MAKKKKTAKKRDKTKYPGLNKNLFSKIKQEYHDMDYVEQLSPEEKEWMSKFMEEYLGARLNHDKRKLHRSKKMKKDCWDRNNARNRDIYGIAKATGKVNDGSDNQLEELQEKYQTQNITEEELIDKIDESND